MAIFENENKQTGKEYLALLETNGDMAAIINPMKGISLDLLKEALESKGLIVEIREPKADRINISL